MKDWDWQYPDMRRVFPRAKTVGCARIEHFTVTRNGSARHIMSYSGDPYAYVQPGEYTRLGVKGKLVMSNTRLEQSTNYQFVRKSNGRVLMGGLGFGMVLFPVAINPNVTEVTVVEMEKDVIDLVWKPITKYLGRRHAKKLKVIHEDVFKFKVPTTEKYDTIYFDIWPDRNEDNLKEMSRLHNYWKFRLNRENPDRWMGSWYQKELQAYAAESRRSRSMGYW